MNLKQKEDLRVIKTKRNLYDGLLKLMKDKPFEEIKVSDICQISLTNRSTFYDHFNDKYELLAAFIQTLKDELTKKLEENHDLKTPKEYYMKMIGLLFDHIEENRMIYASIVKNNNHSIAYDMLQDTLIKDVENHLAKQEDVKGGVPISIITDFYVSAVTTVCLSYIRDPKQYHKEDILNYLTVLVPDEIY